MSAPAPDDAPPDARRMTLGEHLEELRRRVFRACLWWAVGTTVAGLLGDDLLLFVMRPTLRALEASGQPTEVIYTNPADSFGVWFQLVLMLGAFLSAPFAAREIWGFVSAGLYGRERRLVALFAPLSYLLFVGGALFFYYAVQPPTLAFLFETGRPPFPGAAAWTIVHRPDVHRVTSFWMWMSLAMGVVFQLPLVMSLLHRIGVVEAETFAKYRRHFILGAAIVAAVVTPSGDAVTLALFMIPIVALFEGGLLWVRMTDRKGRKP